MSDEVVADRSNVSEERRIQNLALAVLKRAYDDFRGASAGAGKPVGDAEKEQARLFLFGPDFWEASLDFWCHLAGVNPATVRKVARDV